MSGDDARTVRGRTNGDASTRQVVIDAALDCICDLGFYKASSNQIAKSAGVSWGVIQHYFGSRQALLLAVLEDAVQRALAGLHSVDLTGRSLHDKIEVLFDLVFDFFGRREYAAILQILWNLGRDPGTGPSTLAAQDEFSGQLITRWREIFAESFGEHMDEERINFAYLLMWGVAMEEAANSLMPASEHASGRVALARRRQWTVASIEAVLTEQQSAAR